ncbi:MAG: 50S ribosomal protein L9 [Spirochaetaceae bacterium]|jgi:large subunit ribosomal protein L9|nr:50S ribosomal protein L9 [Spirochaetaceae bacterium]
MKVILNKDLNPLGEEGDVRDVAKGYARNYLFPRGIALPYTESTIKLFESRRGEIEARKADKRTDALGLKEKLEGLDLLLSMPAGANGKLYGAVTSQTIVDELLRQGFPVERKRVELPGNTFKSVGKYKVTVKLYENAFAEINITVQGQEIKVETKNPPPNRPRRRRDVQEGTDQTVPEAAVLEAGSPVPPEDPNKTAAALSPGETPDIDKAEISPELSPDTGTVEASQE